VRSFQYADGGVKVELRTPKSSMVDVLPVRYSGNLVGMGCELNSIGPMIARASQGGDAVIIMLGYGG